MLASSQWLRRLQGKISGVWASSGLLEKQWCDNICHCQILERVGWRGIVGGMFVIIVYACDVMSPTNTENVQCRLNPRLVWGLLEVTHQNTRMQLVQIRGSCDGLLGEKWLRDGIMGGLAGKEQILTAVGPRASLSRRYSQTWPQTPTATTANRRKYYPTHKQTRKNYFIIF